MGVGVKHWRQHTGVCGGAAAPQKPWYKKRAGSCGVAVVPCLRRAYTHVHEFDCSGGRVSHVPHKQNGSGGTRKEKGQECAHKACCIEFKFASFAWLWHGPVLKAHRKPPRSTRHRHIAGPCGLLYLTKRSFTPW